jgi:hypothetical protein
LNIKLKDKKKVALNGVSTQTNGGARNKVNNKRGGEKPNKFDSIIYHCFIYNYVEHKIYYYPHKDITQAMLKEKATTIAPKKEEIAINMVLTITTRIQILENVVFKEKKPFKTKRLVDWQEEKKASTFV